MLVLLAGCDTRSKDAEPFSPVAGAVLSVDVESTEAAAELADHVQAELLEDPALASRMLSHGIDPPHGYFFKYKGRCAEKSVITMKMRWITTLTGAAKIRCEDVTAKE